jgi:hypothetical protein
VPSLDAADWLRTTCAAYVFDVVALYRLEGEHEWPLTAASDTELAVKLEEGRHFLPLPKEPAALANILEVSIVDFLLREAEGVKGATALRGTERGYPDVELSGAAFGDNYYAVDVKVARRARAARRTQSRITLYTGNTYFRYPEVRWPGMFRPFRDYALHLDVLAIYTLDPAHITRATDIELIVQEAWRVGSRQRSSTTREYIGAVNSIEALREGRGEFESEEAFYKYWRAYPFRTGRAVEQQLRRLLADQE